ncbi:acyltransferase [Acidiferrimicrobium sp. IK]|uniref:acyltransferase family protein n=1 Tax=Acidiferrimicrobium sp. IK TaxID=2871700 RepID=UPI0021CB3D7C|nr:acyltransferase [Acidiferrimicrobium sp. IK]MCU4185569.1 acyltransferase [Acidiferrimicrobium sp. IK]
MGMTDTTSRDPAAAPVGVSPARGFLGGLEMLRAVAASAVVVDHTWALTTSPHFQGYWLVEGLGEWGVSLFFLISGFILVDSFWNEPPVSARVFWIRRVFRIAPAYYVNVAILFLFFASTSQVFSGQGIKQVAASATFTHWLFPNTASSLNVNGALWTLSIEMCLYLMMPLMAWSMRRRPWLGAGCMLAIGIGYRLWITFDGNWLEHRYFEHSPVGSATARLFMQRQFIGVLPLFVIGMLLRRLVLRWQAAHDQPSARLSPLLLVALLIPSLALLRFVERASDFHHPFFFTFYELGLVTVMAPALVYAALWSASSPSMSGRALVWLGERSYSLYLWHFPIILAVFGRGPEVQPANMRYFWVKVVAVAVLSVAAAAISYAAIERPARTYGRRIARRLGSSERTPRAAVSVPAAG